MKYTLTYSETPEGPTHQLVMEGDFTLVREDVDVGSVCWDNTGGRETLTPLSMGDQEMMYDELGITHVHSVRREKVL